MLSSSMQAQSDAETKIVVDSSATQPGVGGAGAVVAISAAGEGSGARRPDPQSAEGHRVRPR